MMQKKTEPMLPKVSIDLHQSEPLWQRVPLRTSAGEYTCDFMMLIQRFNQQSSQIQTEIINRLYSVLQQYSEVILFADLNMKLNLLWISHLPRIGIGLEVAARIHDQIPQAKLISHQQKHY